ncbi:MAG: D-xylose ABC transporter ATP-binding protein, partial [Martelella sp.]
ATSPKILIVDEPTRGIDVGTKSEVHRLLSELARQGMAIIMVSSELPEVMGMSDRIIVMREGRIATIVENNNGFDAEVLVRAAVGIGEKAA